MTTVMHYTVLSGDTLSSIATSISDVFGVTSAQIETTNPSLNPNNLHIGEIIQIPAQTASNSLMYTIRTGDTLSGICGALSQCSGLTYQEIEQINPSVTASDLQIGQVLAIPATQTTTQETLEPNAENMGYWDWTWDKSHAPSNASLSMAFSGWTNTETALNQSSNIVNNLVGTKFISLGGGNSDGAFDSASLTKITDAINQGEFDSYDGIAYDVEEGAPGLENDFQASFKAAKAKGFKVLVTVSHSAPYGITDASTLMDSFFEDENIDILSPQLYTTGEEAENDYDISQGVTWERYKTAKAAIVPSLVSSTYYPDAQTYFAQQGITLKGYIQWKQV
ncbi:MAG: LysM peptidoglycan-binding domain-containing protein [Marinomonas sp.]